jgi:bacteriocin-like protein
MEASMRKTKLRKPAAPLLMRDANPCSKINKVELSDSELNKVTGGHQPISIAKVTDAATPKVYEGK